MTDGFATYCYNSVFYNGILQNLLLKSNEIQHSHLWTAFTFVLKLNKSLSKYIAWVI